jgi:hypothetical protein
VRIVTALVLVTAALTACRNSPLVVRMPARDAAVSDGAGAPLGGPVNDGAPAKDDAVADVVGVRPDVGDVDAALEQSIEAPLASDASRDSAAVDVSDGPREAGSDVVSLPPRALTRVLANAPWTSQQGVYGMAVDEQDRVYIEDGTNVYLVDGPNVSTYLTFAELTAKTNVTRPSQIMDLDRGPDGLLYILVGGADGLLIEYPQIKIMPSALVRSAAAHVAEPWIDTSMLTFPKCMTVQSAGRAAVVSQEGLTLVSDQGSQAIYKQNQLLNTIYCAWEHLVTAPSGVFLHLRGCNDSTLYRGNLDGSGVTLLYHGNQLLPDVRQNEANFVCTTRDPAGGFYFVLGRPGDFMGPHLYHVSEDASRLELVQTSPTFQEVVGTQSDQLAFDFCALAAAPDGTIFYQTFTQLWRISPR